MRRRTRGLTLRVWSSVMRLTTKYADGAGRAHLGRGCCKGDGFRLGLEALARKEEGNEVLRLLWDEAWPGGVRGGSANGVAALGLGGITVEQAGGHGEFME